MKWIKKYVSSLLRLQGDSLENLQIRNIADMDQTLFESSV